MKTLVVFYSRTGRTRVAAMELARQLNADVEELHEMHGGRMGARGCVLAGRDAWLGRSAPLAPLRYDPSGHDLVVIAGPVWAFTMCPAVRAYLTLCGAKLRRFAFLCTQGGKGAGRAFIRMAALLDRAPADTLILRARQIDQKLHERGVADFAVRLKAFLSTSHQKER
jgi:flavodoxin